MTGQEIVEVIRSSRTMAAIGPDAVDWSSILAGRPVLRTSAAVLSPSIGRRRTLLEVAQPRLPCFTLGLRMGDPHFPRRFAAAGRPGAYLRVIREGDIGAGDQIDVVSRPVHGVTSALVSRAILREPQLLATAEQAPELPAGLRAWMRERAERAAERGDLLADSRPADGSQSENAAPGRLGGWSVRRLALYLMSRSILSTPMIALSRRWSMRWIPAKFRSCASSTSACPAYPHNAAWC
jgi:hypothetical protein